MKIILIYLQIHRYVYIYIYIYIIRSTINRFCTIDIKILQKIKNGSEAFGKLEQCLSGNMEYPKVAK